MHKNKYYDSSQNHWVKGHQRDSWEHCQGLGMDHPDQRSMKQKTDNMLCESTLFRNMGDAGNCSRERLPRLVTPTEGLAFLNWDKENLVMVPHQSCCAFV